MLASSAVLPGQSNAAYTRDGKGRSAFLRACLENNEAEKEALIKRGLLLDLHEVPRRAIPPAWNICSRGTPDRQIIAI